MNRHRDDLRRELVGAASQRREVQGLIPAPVRSQARIIAVAAAALLVVAVASVVASGSRPAAADTFRVEIDGEELVIEVVGRIDDPDAAAAELERNGLSVDLVGVPTPPSLVDVIVSVSFESVEANIDRQDGRVRSVRIPRNVSESLTVRYGRAASQFEAFEATESVPDCGTYSGKLVTEALISEVRRAYGPQIRWQTVGPNGIEQQPDGRLPTGSRLVDLLPIGVGEVLAIVTDGDVPIPPGLAC